MSLITLFRGAGANGHVFCFKGGQPINKGLAFSGLIGPRTIVAVVPTTPQILDFSIRAQTLDSQIVNVVGSLTVTLIPQTAISNFDFTVDLKTGGYTGDWDKTLRAQASERIVRSVLTKMKDLKIEESLHSQQQVEEAVMAALLDQSFVGIGIRVNSCSIPRIEPMDPEVKASIGASERQAMLTDADRALHTRRTEASSNERAIKQYEAETALKLEEARAKLIEQQSANDLKKAHADAEAGEIRLKPFESLSPAKALTIGFMKGCEAGQIGSVTLTSELFAAIKNEDK